ncbi:hypothetical protein [Gimesia panareensis]|uniref:hypothetical protein n=1 Tax=Gimesia panareensis TaxID=2527978 RepID=UPI00118A7755|nr:hypothetical protein [Gimesia panareensis]QDU52422.1 hypothetical protein Pan110_47990 [Gimesia panareensis]
MMNGVRKKLFVSAVLLGIWGTGQAVQTAQAGGGRLFLSFCELCQETGKGKQAVGSTYPWPLYSYHQYRGKHCNNQYQPGPYRRYEYARYHVKSPQPFPGQINP